MEHTKDHQEAVTLENQEQPVITRDKTDYSAFEDPSQSFVCDSCQ